MNIQNMTRNRGFSLIEVMIAVVILSFGLVALTALQGGLFRAGAEAKARANAMTLAQNALENARAYVFVNAASAPAGYKGGIYSTLGNQTYTTTLGGIPYTVTQAVTTQNAGAVNEFKDVTVTVAWQGSDETKQVQLVDTMPNVGPRDSIQVLKTPTDSESGPQVWIVPPNKNNPTVVPIAVGDDKSAASSNPKPEQFVDDLSAATKFTVMNFTGSSAGSEVRLTRRLDVAAVSCLCQRNGSEVSSANNPAYKPTIWNGKQQAYLEPLTAPSGTPIATPVTNNSDITPMCTTCCRDHREAAGRADPRPDPWRALTATETTEEHWGYKKKGGNYVVGEPIVPWSLDSTNGTSGEYLEACQLVRVNGRLRVAADAQQADIVVAPLNDAGTAYRDSSFIANYGAYVKDLVKNGMSGLPSGYAAPSARFPGASAALKSTYSSVTSPATIDVTSASVGTKRPMVGFGLYVDYISADTKAAYACALAKNNTGSCAGLGTLDPLETLPFYAVNVANLGTWLSSRPGVVSVADAQYKQGLLVADGGTAIVQAGTAGTSAAPENIVLSLAMNNSNSGLAATNPIDPDDAASSNSLVALQNFTRFGSGTTTTVRNSLFIKLVSTSTLSLKSISATSGGVICGSVSNTDPTKNCRFQPPVTGMTVDVSGYTTSSKVKGSTVINNRKVCVPSLVGASVASNGTTAETTTLTFPLLAQKDYTLTIDIVDEASACPTGTVSLSPYP